MQLHHTDTFRESVISVLGAPPDPAPLDPHVLDVQAGEGFRREHIRFQVSPGDYSYAYLLIPTNLKTPAPAVYAHHRYDSTFTLGKSEVIGLGGDRNYAFGLDLVKRGYVVFAPDTIGFGERRSSASTGNSYDQEYRFHELALRLLRGETLLKKVLWDISRGFDYLETRQEVDSRFLGIMGCGYGGKMALWATAMETRVRAGVAHGGITSLREHIRRGDWFQPEFMVPRLMQVAETHHILSLVLPRPFLISMPDDGSLAADLNDIQQKVTPLYEKLYLSNRLSFYRYGKTDTFESRMRFNIYSWLDTWMKPF